MKLSFLILFGFVTGYARGQSNISRVARAGGANPWTNAVIPYSFDQNFDNGWDQQDFVSAIKYIEDRTCIRFRQKQSVDRYWLNVEKGGCCSSYIGQLEMFKDRGQPITFSGGHGPPFYLHELGHAVAYPHEQDRHDRDDFIVWDNNKQGCAGGGFADKTDPLNEAQRESLFDYVSLMADWTECYWPRDFMPKNIPLGPGGAGSRTFSVVDIERMNAIYDCRGCYGYRFRNIRYRSSFQNPLESGYELDRSTFYVCRVYHEGHLVIGKSKPDSQECWAAFEGEEHRYAEGFEVLTDPYNSGFRWQGRPDDFSIPRNAIKGGRTKDRETLYIARCLLTVNGDTTVIPGSVLVSNGREVRIPFNGGTQRCQDFEYLVCG